MDEAATPEPPWADRGWYLAVEFQQSSSAKFERALKMAAGHPGFAALIDEGGHCIYRTLYRADELRPLPRLLNIIGSWKSTRLYFCGREVALEAVEDWLPCYLQQARYRQPACRRRVLTGATRWVGCHYAGISLDTADWDVWYRHGEFDLQGIFQIRKGYLEARVASWEARFGGCPFADGELLSRVVARLPSSIDARADRRWRVARGYFGDSMMVAPAGSYEYQAFLSECLSGTSRQ